MGKKQRNKGGTDRGGGGAERCELAAKGSKVAP